jgi:flagellar motility protein MotE (MotC chaperone)
MNWQVAFNFLIGTLTVLATIYATRAGKKGKDADRAQQALSATSDAEQRDRAQRFAEITRSLEEARNDLVYYKKELAESRKAEAELDRKLDKLQAEWRSRHRELLNRCQEMSDVMADILRDSDIPVAQRKKMSEAIRQVRQHIRHDHEMFVGEDTI